MPVTLLSKRNSGNEQKSCLSILLYFSDDIAWVKENLPLQNAVYIDWNTDEDSWQDMMLMSHCKHHIICNSTFSWWGAWLNPNMDKTVIVPSRWFQHSGSSGYLSYGVDKSTSELIHNTHEYARLES